MAKCINFVKWLLDKKECLKRLNPTTLSTLFVFIVLIIVFAYKTIPNKETFYATTLGSFLAFFLAFVLYRISLYSDNKVKDQAKQDNTIYVYELYKMELEKNISHLNHLIEKEWIPYYRLKTIARDTLWGQLADYSKDLVLIRRLNETYAEFELINNKTDILNDARFAKLEAKINLKGENQYNEEIKNQLSGCIQLGKNAIKMASECINIIDCKIENIQKVQENPRERCSDKTVESAWVFRWLVDLVILFCLIFLCMRFLFKNSFFDSFTIASESFLYVGLFTYTLQQARKFSADHKIKHSVFVYFVSCILAIPLVRTSRDIFYPIISDRIVTTKQNRDFRYNEKLGQYQIKLDNKIEDVDVFYTSYDKNGEHKARMHWVKGIDYEFKDNYIQTIHNLNKGYDPEQVLGTHTIRYKYRTSISNYYNKLREQQLEKELFFRNFGK